jgi:hypothetical protein
MNPESTKDPEISASLPQILTFFRELREDLKIFDPADLVLEKMLKFVAERLRCRFTKPL